MTAAEFVKQYCEASGWTEKEFYESQVPMPDETSPYGWAAVSNSPLAIKAHVDLYLRNTHMMPASVDMPQSGLQQQIFQACKHFLLCCDGSGKNYDSIFYEPETELSFSIYELAEKLGIVTCKGNRCWSLLPQVRDEIDAVYRKYALIMLSAAPAAPEQEV